MTKVYNLTMIPPIPQRRKTCIFCGQEDLHPLMWIRRNGEPPGSPGHNILYESSSIAACNACGQAQLEEHSHDCFSPPGEEDWDMYWWYLLDPEERAWLERLLAACPAPLDPACACPLHQGLRASCETLYDGAALLHHLPHAPFPGGSVAYRRLALEESAGKFRLRLVINETE
jgi:hypothetical protein